MPKTTCTHVWMIPYFSMTEPLFSTSVYKSNSHSSLHKLILSTWGGGCNRIKFSGNKNWFSLNCFICFDHSIWRLFLLIFFPFFLVKDVVLSDTAFLFSLLLIIFSPLIGLNDCLLSFVLIMVYGASPVYGHRHTFSLAQWLINSCTF